MPFQTGFKILAGTGSGVKSEASEGLDELGVIEVRGGKGINEITPHRRRRIPKPVVQHGLNAIPLRCMAR